jgi:hypothetical protein
MLDEKSNAELNVDLNAPQQSGIGLLNGFMVDNFLSLVRITIYHSVN